MTQVELPDALAERVHDETGAQSAEQFTISSVRLALEMENFEEIVNE